MIDNATDLELTIIEHLLSDDCKCEAPHPTTVCSYKVTHRNLSCMFDQLGCLNAAMYIMQQWEYRERHNVTCAACGRNLGKCWNIVPV